MRIYTAGLIDISSQSNNVTLQKRLLSNYRKSLGIPGSAITSQELNTFIVLSGQKDDGKIEKHPESSKILSKRSTPILQRSLTADWRRSAKIYQTCTVRFNREVL
jgi:hypothetical protein